MVLYHNSDSSTDLAAFGEGRVAWLSWTSPLSQVQYNVYQSLADCINNGGTMYGGAGGPMRTPRGFCPANSFWACF